MGSKSKKHVWVIFSFLLLAAGATAEEEKERYISTREFYKIGKFYNVWIHDVTSKGLQISHAGGTAYIQEGDVTDLQKKLIAKPLRELRKLHLSEMRVLDVTKEGCWALYANKETLIEEKTLSPEEKSLVRKKIAEWEQEKEKRRAELESARKKQNREVEDLLKNIGSMGAQELRKWLRDRDLYGNNFRNFDRKYRLAAKRKQAAAAIRKRAAALTDWQNGEAALRRNDIKEAVKWYRKAAEKDHAEAQLKLAEMYLGNKGHVGLDEAEKWLRKAAGSSDKRLKARAERGLKVTAAKRAALAKAAAERAAAEKRAAEERAAAAKRAAEERAAAAKRAAEERAAALALANDPKAVAQKYLDAVLNRNLEQYTALLDSISKNNWQFRRSPREYFNFYAPTEVRVRLFANDPGYIVDCKAIRFKISNKPVSFITKNYANVYFEATFKILKIERDPADRRRIESRIGKGLPEELVCDDGEIELRKRGGDWKISDILGSSINRMIRKAIFDFMGIKNPSSVWEDSLH